MPTVSFDDPSVLDQRSALRKPLEWQGAYRVLTIRSVDQSVWRPCTALDLSTGGIALEAYGPAPALRDTVLLRLDPEPSCRPVGLQLRGRIRNLRQVRYGTLLGVEFEALHPLQRRELSRLVLDAFDLGPEPRRS